jgi:hypothetical protein
VSEWLHLCWGGRDGPALRAASTGGEAIADANARRCQGERRPGPCANPATCWRAASKIVGLYGVVGNASRSARTPLTADAVPDSRTRPLGVHSRSTRGIGAGRAQPACAILSRNHPQDQQGSRSDSGERQPSRAQSGRAGD